MSGEPSFSVVVPTHARPAALALCLEALARLDYPRDAFEVVVVDDDGGIPLDGIVACYRDRLDVTLAVQDRAGPSAARNAGVRRAKGEYVAFTDDDCRPEPGWLRALAARFERDREAAVGGRTVNGLPRNAFARASQLVVDLVYAHYNDDPECARFLASNNVAFPADGFQEAGGFDESFRTSEDRELCDRWVAGGRRLVYAPEAGVEHVRDVRLGGFLRQHFGYGRGAFRFHRARARRGSSSLQGHVRFHLRLPRLLRSAPSETGALRSPSVVALLFAWQLANALGFAWEGTRFALAAGRRGRPQERTLE